MEHSENSVRIKGTSSASIRSSQGLSPVIVVSRVILMIIMMLLIYLGYRLWVVRTVDQAYQCVEQSIAAVDSIDAVVDGSTGLSEAEADVVREAAAQAQVDLENAESCFSHKIKGASEDLVETCSLVTENARDYALMVEEAAASASRGEDTYDSQQLIEEAYSLFRFSVSACDDSLESAFSTLK